MSDVWLAELAPGSKWSHAHGGRATTPTCSELVNRTSALAQQHITTAGMPV